MSEQHDGKLVLSVRKLSISFRQNNHRVQVVNNFFLDVKQGETIAIVGGSGSGKSVTSLAIIRLIEQNRQVVKSTTVISG